MSTRQTLCASLAVLIVLSGCALLTDRIARPEAKARTVLADLEEAFEDESTRDFMDRVHSDYEQTAVLQHTLDAVFARYGQSDLTWTSVRVTDANGQLTVTTRWDLRWVCDQPQSDGAPSCQRPNDDGRTIKRTGKTEFVFDTETDGDELKLRHQRDPIVFGSITPGSNNPLRI